MRRRTGIASAILSIVLLAAAPPTQRHYRIDPEASGVNARVAFFGLASKTAQFPAVMGRLSLPDAAASRPTSAIALDVTLDARMLQAGDAVTLKRLKGKDFFDVEHYPNVKFSGEMLRMTAARTAEIDGELTVRGVTRPETLHVTFGEPPAENLGARPILLTGTMRIDRRAYGMTAWSLIVGRKVDITIRTRMVPS
ncbi:YceI family protein [Novosphingobium album (ex Hu et al. 2023)]|uniref:YceI family protein n=1 Tax=Novosphingobium album (ex Hu et al. 2023) TaxID=2930093 RepID=A0ABT0AZ98_9SPHN|nr:YceI family protein [Novosphingobium album (ex Hu et al. 2023)]MCJ2178107.1 YceI family protein [Novosphingobium album (ex Hu et al. 2023)]